MPRYDFRCPSGHLHERFFSIASLEREVPCADCGATASLVILSAPSFSVDRLSEAGFDHAAGRVWRNKQEKRDWMKTAGIDGGPVEELDTSTSRKSAEQLQAKREERMSKDPAIVPRIKRAQEYERKVQRGELKPV